MAIGYVTLNRPRTARKPKGSTSKKRAKKHQRGSAKKRAKAAAKKASKKSTKGASRMAMSKAKRRAAGKKAARTRAAKKAARSKAAKKAARKRKKASSKGTRVGAPKRKRRPAAKKPARKRRPAKKASKKRGGRRRGGSRVSVPVSAIGKWLRKGMDKGVKHPGSARKRPRYRKGKKLTAAQKANLVKWGLGVKRGKGVYINRRRRHRNTPSLGSIKAQLKSLISVRGAKTVGCLIVGAAGAQYLPALADRLTKGKYRLQDGYVGVATSVLASSITSALVTAALGSECGQHALYGGLLVSGIKLIQTLSPRTADQLMLPRVQGRSAAPAPIPADAQAAVAAQAAMNGMGIPEFVSPESLIAGEAMHREGLKGFLPMDGFVDPAALAIRDDFVPGPEEF